MSNPTTSRALGAILGGALLLPHPVMAQTPAQPARLHVTSTPDAAIVTINGSAMARKTPADFIVAPGAYTIETVGQPGKSTCGKLPLTVASGVTLSVDCSNETWTRK